MTYHIAGERSTFAKNTCKDENISMAEHHQILTLINFIVMKITIPIYVFTFCLALTASLFLNISNVYGDTSVELYQVNVSSSLNVRHTPDNSGTIIGKLDNGEIVKVISITNGWARIDYNGKTGYVSYDYLDRYSVKQHDEKIHEDKGMFQFMSRNISDKFLYITIALAFITYLIYKLESEHLLILSYALMTISQLIYLSGHFGPKGLLPFIDIFDIGLLWGIFGFICFAVFLGFQLYMLIVITNILEDESGCDIDIRVGFWGWIITFGYLIINAIFFDSRHIEYPIAAMIAVQVIQVILSIIRNIRNISTMILYNIIYLISVFAFTLSFIELTVMLILFGIAFIALRAIVSDKPRSCSWCRSYDNGYCYYRQRSVNSSSSCSKFER